MVMQSISGLFPEVDFLGLDLRKLGGLARLALGVAMACLMLNPKARPRGGGTALPT